MLSSLLNYTPSIPVGPVSAQAPAQLSAVSKQAPLTAQQQAFNLPAYMRQNTTQGQWNEMNTANQNRYRGSLANSQSSLGRQMSQANAQQSMNSLGAATSAANNYYDIMTGAMEGDRQNRLGWMQGLAQLGDRRRQMFSQGPFGQLFSGMF